MKLVLSLILAVAAAPALAQPPDETALVDELVVRAYGGPPWWTVSDGDSTVYILAQALAVPKGHGWDRTLLEKRLTGAKRLILPISFPPFRLGILDARKLYAEVNRGGSRPPLETRLSSAVSARFRARREALAQPESRYAALPAGAAAMRLAGDAYKGWGLPVAPPSGDEVLPVVLAAARAKRVRTETPRYSGPKVEGTVGDVLRPGEACAAAILGELDKGRPRTFSTEEYRGMQTAWADGDIRPALASVSASDDTRHQLRVQVGEDHFFWLPSGAWSKCGVDMPKTRGPIEQRNPVKDTTAAIARQLQTPGHAVAIVGPWTLLSRDGVLDRLRRQGYEVTTPATQNAD